MKHRFFFKPLIWLVIFALIGLAVMLLWNALIPGLFGVPSVDYPQALGLLVLCRLLVGGGGRPFAMMRERLHERWQAMSEEERHAFHERRRDRFVHQGRGHGAGRSKEKRPESRPGSDSRQPSDLREASEFERPSDSERTDG